MKQRDCPLCRGLKLHLTFERKDPNLGQRSYWKCATCRLFFLAREQRLSRKDEKARYDLHNNEADDPKYAAFLQKLADPLAKLIKPKARGLDFGCGPTPVLSRILRDRGFGMRYYDPFYFPDKRLLTGKYDFITCTETLEHLYKPREELILLGKLLAKSGGHLAIMTEVLEDPHKFPEWWYHRDPTHVAFYQRETFQWIAGWLKWSVQYPHPNVVIFTT